MDGAVTTLPNCARCGDLATLVCKDCREENLGTGELVGTTGYCSAACQNDDWPRHKEYCVTTREVMEFRNQTPLQSVDSAHPCIVCQNPTTKSCKGCEGARNATTGPFEITYYCSTACQTAHWSQHSSSCLASQERRKLCAAGVALRELYYDYCKDYIIIMLENGSLNQNHMIFHEEGSVQHTTNAISLLNEIPLDSEEARAFLGCMVGSLYMREMGIHIKSSLKGIIPHPRQASVPFHHDLSLTFPTKHSTPPPSAS